MGNFIDEVNKRHGRLVVISRAPNNSANQAQWECQCDCGNKATVTGINLRKGDTKSCGCAQRDWTRKMGIMHHLPPGQAALNSLLSSYKKSARKRNYSFALTKKQFRNITSKRCSYCGIKPTQVHRTSKGSGTYTYNGIDRVDNSKGYELSNTVPCCGVCNAMKETLSRDKFLNHIRRIGEWQTANLNRQRPLK